MCLTMENDKDIERLFGMFDQFLQEQKNTTRAVYALSEKISVNTVKIEHLDETKIDGDKMTRSFELHELTCSQRNKEHLDREPMSAGKKTGITAGIIAAIFAGVVGIIQALKG